jgi:hypothetical protein
MTTALERRDDERARFLVLWVIPIVVGALTAFARPILNDGDTFWHIAAGRWMIAHGGVPGTDPFSFTYVGRPWITHEWLTEVIMAAAFFAGGWSGLMLLTGVATGALTALMSGWLLRWLSPLTAIVTLLLASICIFPGVLARPHLLVLPVLALWTIELLKARCDARAPSVWLIPLMGLWANLHGSFIVGAALLAAFAAEAALDVKRWRRATLLGWSVILVGAGLATLATPHGLTGLSFPLQVLNMKTLPTITEWRGPDFIAGGSSIQIGGWSLKLEPLEIALLAGLFALFWRGAKLTAVRALIVLGLVHMSLQHVRQEVLLGVIAPLIVAEPVGRALGASMPASVSWRLPPAQTALGATLIALVVGARLVVPEIRVDGPTAPISAFANVPPDLRRAPVLNDYDFGGYLIFKGVRPYIDGRADMYGDAFVANDDLIQRGDGGAVAAAITRYHIRWALLRPDRPLVGVLQRTPGWKTTYKDQYAVLLVGN